MLLQRAALISRVSRGRPPDPLAGLKVDDEDLAVLLEQLPGMEQAHEEAAEVEQATAETVSLAVKRFVVSLQGSDRFAVLVRRAALPAGEAIVLALLCAIEADPRRQRLVGYLNDDVTARRPTLWTLGQICGPDDQAAMAALGPGGSLRRACLVRPASDGPWASSPIEVAAPVMWWLHGVAGPEPDLPPGLEFLGGRTGIQPGEWPASAGGSVGSGPVDSGPVGSGPVGDGPGGAVPGGAGAGGGGPVVVAAGRDRRRRLQAVAGKLPAPRFFVVTGVPADGAQWDALVRQATLLDAGVILDVEDDLPPAARDRLERAAHLCWGVTSPNELPVASLPIGWVEVPVEASVATDAEWEEAFGPGVTPSLPLTAEQVELAGRVAAANRGVRGGSVAGGGAVAGAGVAGGGAVAGGGGAAVAGDGMPDGAVPDAVRRLAAGHIDATANRIRPTRTWDDLVLDSDREELVRTVAVRCRQRRTVYEQWGFSPSPSRGVVALFAGPSGTGKTLAAEVIAGELGVDVYAIDLANLVSKYIGETEKNLGRVFDAAEASNVALFFDEADALLGKRSAVSDAHDRYANIEVAYLLQRLERYDGLAIMATNLVNNLDPAFVRRLHVVVEFTMPGPAERRRIWERCLPSQAPVAADLDLEALAQHFELSGGTIRNAMLGAAFLAAEAGTPITMAVALRSLQMELRKIGRLVSDTDLRPFASHLE